MEAKTQDITWFNFLSFSLLFTWSLLPSIPIFLLHPFFLILFSSSFLGVYGDRVEKKLSQPPSLHAKYLFVTTKVSLSNVNTIYHQQVDFYDPIMYLFIKLTTVVNGSTKYDAFKTTKIQQTKIVFRFSFQLFKVFFISYSVYMLDSFNLGIRLKIETMLRNHTEKKRSLS